MPCDSNLFLQYYVKLYNSTIVTLWHIYYRIWFPKSQVVKLGIYFNIENMKRIVRKELDFVMKGYCVIVCSIREETIMYNENEIFKNNIRPLSCKTQIQF